MNATWESVSSTIWAKFITWLYEIVYDGLVEFFTLMTEIGANLFDPGWVKTTLKFFSVFGCGLFIAGFVVAIFDITIEYQSVRAINIKRNVLPFLSGLLTVIKTSPMQYSCAGIVMEMLNVVMRGYA